MGSNSEVAFRNYGALESFRTEDVLRENGYQKASRILYYSNGDAGRTSSKLPAIAVGLSKLDLDASKNPRVYSHIDDISADRVRAVIETWGDSVMHTGSCSLFKASAEDTRFQIGDFNVYEGDGHGPQNERWFTFRRPYRRPPQVVCWLSKFDMAFNINWRVKARISEVTTDGFRMHLDTWANTQLNSVTAFWIAMPADIPGVFSGSFGTESYRTWENPQQHNSGMVYFPQGKFVSPPTVVMAIHYLDADSRFNLRFDMKATEMTKDGFKWNIDTWGDSVLYVAGGSYIAYAK